MPTLEEWMGLEPGSGEAQVAVEVFRLRPEWLGLGDLSQFELCRFVSPLEAVEPLVLEWDDVSLFWGMWHSHLLWAYGEMAPRVAAEAVETIDGVLKGEVVRLVAFSSEDKWAGSMLAERGMASLELAVQQFGPHVARVEATSWTAGKTLR